MNRVAATACFIMAIGIIMGAFGAHALRDVFVGRQEEIWKTAVFYQLINALGLLFVSSRQEVSGKSFKIVTILLLTGIAIFSGSLYCLVLSNQNWFGAITPIGGSLLIAAWILLGLKLWNCQFSAEQKTGN